MVSTLSESNISFSFNVFFVYVGKEENAVTQVGKCCGEIRKCSYSCGKILWEKKKMLLPRWENIVGKEENAVTHVGKYLGKRRKCCYPGGKILLEKKKMQSLMWENI